MIDDDAIAHPEAAAAGAGADDLAGGFMAGDHSLVAFRALTQVLVVNAADVGAADGGGLHAEEHFTMAGRGNGHLLELGGAIAGQVGAQHHGG